jgi:hypothetical protein
MIAQQRQALHFPLRIRVAQGGAACVQRPHGFNGHAEGEIPEEVNGLIALRSAGADGAQQEQRQQQGKQPPGLDHGTSLPSLKQFFPRDKTKDPKALRLFRGVFRLFR